MKQKVDYLQEKHRISSQYAIYLGCNVLYNDYPYQLRGIDAVRGCELFNQNKDIEFHNVDVFQIKLILRPLSDIQREETIEIAKLLYSGIDDNNDVETFHIIEKGLKGEIKGITWLRDLSGCFRVTQYLLSKHFDLFGLISSGKAVDLTKMEFKPITANG